MWENLHAEILSDIAEAQRMAARALPIEALMVAVEEVRRARRLSPWEKRQRATQARELRRCPFRGPQLRLIDADRRERVKADPAYREERLAAQRTCMRRLQAERHPARCCAACGAQMPRKGGYQHAACESCRGVSGPLTAEQQRAHRAKQAREKRAAVKKRKVLDA